VYFKPALGKLVFRPTNVIRSSEKVLEINRKLIEAKVKPATACKGLPWRDFVVCLSKKMKEIVGKPAAPAA